MKNRLGFVTNSSSSSFIIRNKTDRTVTSKELAEELAKRLRDEADAIINDAEGRFEIEPNGEVEIECGDHYDDGAFENYIHNEVGWGTSTDSFSITYGESHH